MSQQFITQLEKVCSRRRRSRWLTATCWAFALVIVAMFVLIGLDYAINIQHGVGRFLLSAFFVSCLGVIAMSWRGALSNPTTYPTTKAGSKTGVTPLMVAHEVEQFYPESKDFVSSAWDFCQQSDDDPTAGSESLRRAVILRADAATAEVDWSQFVSHKPLLKAACALVVAALLTGAMIWWHPQIVRIGLARLTGFSSNIEWPRNHDLQFVETPDLLAAGEDLVLRLRDTRMALPPAIIMHYRTRQQGRWQEETQTIATMKNSLEIRRPNIHESLQYRATGGDHLTMPWQSLEVVPAPQIEQLQVTVYPPAYMRLPSHPWNKNTSIYGGSELALQGQTDQPVTQAVLVSKHGGQITAQVGPEGRHLRIEHTDWQINKHDTYTLQLTTATGLIALSPTEMVFDVIADQPPKVHFVQPTSDLTLLSTVSVPLVIEASDESALQYVELLFTRSDRPSEERQQVLLWKSTADSKEKDATKKQIVNFLWHIKPLALTPGSILEVHALATDNQPATGKTPRTLRLHIVSEDELWHQIFQQQTRVVEKLTRLMRDQRELRSSTADWAEFPDWPKPRWANASHASLFRQRQIRISLDGGPRTVLGQLRNLNATIVRNQLFRPEVVDRLQAAQALLQGLHGNSLRTIEQSLSEIARQIQRSSVRKDLLPLISMTGEQQEQVVASLRQVIDLLMPANVLGRLERELTAIEAEQQVLAQRCRKTITPQMLFEEDKKSAVLADALRQQRELARRMAELLLGMRQSAERHAEEEPLFASRLTETVTLAGELGTQATLQSAANQLLRRRLGRASTLQEKAIEDLAKLKARLTGLDAGRAAERLKKLRASERELQKLRRQVAAIEQERHKLQPKKGKELAKQAETIVGNLEKLRIRKAASSTKNAASRLRRPSPQIKKARQQLDLALQQLATARRRQQVALARLEMARLDAKIDSLVARQQSIQDRIERQEHKQSKEQDFAALAASQADLRTEVLTEAEQLTTFPVFAHLLKQTGETMQVVKMRLQQEEIKAPTAALAGQAAGQLAQLAKVLRQERKKFSAKGRSNRDAGQRKAGQGGAYDKLQEETLQLALGQLKLLRTLQGKLQQQTKTLQQNPHLALELARQQKQLTNLARQLLPDTPDQESPYE